MDMMLYHVYAMLVTCVFTCVHICLYVSACQVWGADDLEPPYCSLFPSPLRPKQRLLRKQVNQP